MKDFVLTLDRNAEIQIQARIKITTEPPPAAAQSQVKLSATYGGVTSTYTGADTIMYTLPADKQVLLQIGYVDKNGNAARVDGAVTWESSNTDIARVEPVTPTQNVDPNTPEGGVVTLIPGTQIGACQVTAKADADLGDGVRELVTLLDVTVVGGEAVAGTITPIGEQTPVPDGARSKR